MKRQPSHTPEQWQSHIDAWKISGHTQAAYCRAHGIIASVFQYWKKRLSRATATESIPKQDAIHPAMVPVTVVNEPLATRALQGDRSPAVAATASLSLHVGQRYRIDLPPGFHPATLCQLLAILPE